MQQRKEKVKKNVEGKRQRKEEEGKGKNNMLIIIMGMNGLCWGEGVVGTHLAQSGRWTEKQAKTKFWD